MCLPVASKNGIACLLAPEGCSLGVGLTQAACSTIKSRQGDVLFSQGVSGMHAQVFLLWDSSTTKVGKKKVGQNKVGQNKVGQKKVGNTKELMTDKTKSCNIDKITSFAKVRVKL